MTTPDKSRLLVLGATIAETKDRELGRLLILFALDKLPDLGPLYDRAAVCGEFGIAEAVREMVGA